MNKNNSSLPLSELKIDKNHEQEEIKTVSYLTNYTALLVKKEEKSPVSKTGPFSLNKIHLSNICIIVIQTYSTTTTIPEQD